MLAERLSNLPSILITKALAIDSILTVYDKSFIYTNYINVISGYV